MHQRSLRNPRGIAPHIEIIGRGAFATVYKAKMKYYPYRIRAVKRIKKNYIKNPNTIINEYTILKSFDHPQIIKIYETFEDKDNFFMVLEYSVNDVATVKEGNFLTDWRKKEISQRAMPESFLFRCSIS